MQILLAACSILLILAVFLSLIKSDFWIYKILEYPRLQKLALTATATACWFFFWPLQNRFYQAVFGGLILSILFLVYKIWPYTFLAKREMRKARSTDPQNELKVFAANVLQDNRQYQRLLNQIKSVDPDIIFLVETNTAWINAMKELEKDYSYKLQAPLENTYGLLFYSRLPCTKGKIMFLVKSEVPSIEVVVELRSGQKVQLWGLHPEPPVPGENLYSTAKDKELMKIALKVQECSLPCIVLGDLNDVAWSHTTQLFRKTSELLDPRRGRGFYSTFSAHSRFIRFPLDYIFCSKNFGLVEMRRLPKNGSDHFATLTHLAFSHHVKGQKPAQADEKELREAKDMATEQVVS
ncbi:MAG TPA: endonuclease/exonuclease/phosphatase family protein [Chitinophagaceae bacterium]|nr:endonuclease/exonuclease/phosphatase family protein [Chitinophagaceae bacterium]